MPYVTMCFESHHPCGPIKGTSVHVPGPDIFEMALNMVVMALMVVLEEGQNVADKSSLPAADRLDPSLEPCVKGTWR